MKRLVLFAVAAVAFVFVQGCSSIQTAEEMNGQKISASGSNVAHVHGSSWGLYCLSIPLISGDTSKIGSVAWGKDTVNVNAVTSMVTEKSKTLGATSTLDLQSATSSFWIMPTFVLFIKSVEVSGNAVK
ncbi:MAG: hypothetical protein ACYC4Q_02500 [Victivallaceae bacterium]